MWNVIVVGAGPGGSAAAKACSQLGLKTLVLEKKKLPRDKVCSGMVAGIMAQGLIKDEFGIIPRQVLTPPYVLSGQMFHAPGLEPQNLEWKTLLAWRKDLDFWLIEKAQEKGAEIWDRSRLLHIEEDNGQYRVHIKRETTDEEFSVDFVIGADGAGSRVRKYLFPDLKVRYSVPIRECYEGSLDLDHGYMHWFFPKSRPRPRFNINHKGDCFLVEGSGIKDLRPEVAVILSPYGFHPESKPIWRDACMIPQLHGELVSGAFTPARENVLLIGDAAGLLFPITFEGIGVALKSGMLAAAAIFEAAESGRAAAEGYLKSLQPVIEELRTLHLLGKSLEQKKNQEGENWLKALKAGYEAPLSVA